METENNNEMETNGVLMFNDENKVTFHNYLTDLIIDKSGKGNDPIRMYGVREKMRTCVQINRRQLAEILNVKYKTINNWLFNTHDTGIPVEKALLLYSKIGRDQHELFDLTAQFGCTNSKKCKLPKHMTSELAYLFGYIMGDGHLANPEDTIGNGSNYNAEIRITTEDKNHLEYLKSIFEKYFNYSPHLYRENNFYRLIGRSKVIHKFLSTVCGIPTGDKKTKTLVPKIVLNNIELEQAFISGLFDSDGNTYIDKKGRISLKIKQYNRKLLEECQRIFTKLGFHTHIYQSNGFRNGKITRAHVLMMYRQKEVTRFIAEFQSFKIKEVLARVEKRKN